MSEELPRATSVLTAGSWRRSSAADHLVLSYEERHRRRRAFVAQGGTAFVLDLPRTVLLAAGDGLLLGDGRVIAVEAAPEALLRITAPDAATLVRLAWHLGNRHLPVQLAGDHLLIRADPVIADMLRGLGATLQEVQQPFMPEAGAYGPGTHGHGHALSPPAPPNGGLEGIQDRLRRG
jgi:urease accessory protein